MISVELPTIMAAGALILASVGVIAAFLFGASCGEWDVKREAVRLGLAEYSSNRQGKSIWRWREQAVDGNYIAEQELDRVLNET